MATAGYSGTPLTRKLGLKDGMAVLALGAPEALLDWLHPLPPVLRLVVRKELRKDVHKDVHKDPR